MTLRNQNEKRSSGLEPISAKLAAEPLTFLAEDHMRHRQVCAYLVANAQATTPDFKTMALSLAFLRHDFLLHDADERASLYPIMRERCKPEDEIEILIHRLMADHDYAREAVQTVCGVLERLLNGEKRFDDDDRNSLIAFADKVKRYIILENAVILPLARARLGKSDIKALAKAMLMRRGIVETKTRRRSHRNGSPINGETVR